MAKPQPPQSNAAPSSAISPTREEDFPEWFQQVVKASEMAEHSEVRGCMVIKPWGYGVWENMRDQLDAYFKATGHRNAYFPLLIPLSYMQKEAEHVEGFAKECAVVTHHRLEADADGNLQPAAPLTEPLIIRPTSETIIGETYAKWVQSYRDLPILLNQWANVMRWEMRTRLFLRTAEFLWQEGHTVHETAQEAIEETERMLELYRKFFVEHLAIPVIPGRKTENERFPGADDTLCVEAMVQDRKAVQAGTSHFLGQNFSKSAGIQFSGRDGEIQHAWTTSWGVSTRMIGTMIMAHADDDGMIMPPRIAPAHLVILPVTPKPDTKEAVLAACDQLARDLRKKKYHGDPLVVELDDRDLGGGVKNWEWIKRGIPLRVELGPRDLEKGSVAVSRRDRGHKEKEFIPIADFVKSAPKILEDMQKVLLQRATEFREAHTVEITSKDDFISFFTPDNSEKPEIHGGFALAHWDGTRETEEEISDQLRVSIRCIPFDKKMRGKKGKCVWTGQPSEGRVVFARSY